MVSELIPLALFDSKTSVDDKQILAATLLSFERPNHFQIGKPNFAAIIEKLEVENKPYSSEFINNQSWSFFETAKKYLKAKQIDVPFLAV